MEKGGELGKLNIGVLFLIEWCRQVFNVVFVPKMDIILSSRMSKPRFLYISKCPHSDGSQTVSRLSTALTTTIEAEQ